MKFSRPAVTCCMHGKGCKKGNKLSNTEEAEGDYVDLNEKLDKSQRDTTINASKQFNEQQLSKEAEDAHAAGYYDLVRRRNSLFGLTNLSTLLL